MGQGTFSSHRTLSEAGDRSCTPTTLLHSFSGKPAPLKNQEALPFRLFLSLPAQQNHPLWRSGHCCCLSCHWTSGAAHYALELNSLAQLHLSSHKAPLLFYSFSCIYRSLIPFLCTGSMLMHLFPPTVTGQIRSGQSLSCVQLFEPHES